METLVFETALGHTALARHSGCVHALSFGHKSNRAALKALSHTTGTDCPADEVYAGDDKLVDKIFAFAAGEHVDFADLEIDASHLTDFGQKVTAACRQIAWGETLTYSELAKRAGRPGAARAVGSVMARNRVPLIVPCHRVVPASGGLGGFSAPQGVSMKKRLLDMESEATLLLGI